MGTEYKLSNLEKETVIIFNEKEKTAEVCTYNTKLKNRLEQSAMEHPEDCVVIRPLDSQGMIEYRVPKKWVKVNPPRRRNLTDEQKAAISERFRQIREKQQIEKQTAFKEGTPSDA